MENKNHDERFFTVELKSKSHLTTVDLRNSHSDNVLLEGTIGKLVKASFVEGVILEIAGRKGTLRINLEKAELKDASETGHKFKKNKSKKKG